MLEVKHEENKDKLCDVSKLCVGDVFVDEESGATMMVLSPYGVMEALYQLKKNPNDNVELKQEGSYITAIDLEYGELMVYHKPHRKVCKRVSSARLYLKS